jgi:hypothetical protein
MGATASITLANSRITQAPATGQPTYLDKFGSGYAPAGSFTLANGTGNNTANIVYRGNEAGALVVPAGGSITISLKGTGGELDSLNKALSLSTVRMVYVELVTPGNGNKIGIGPAGNAACANLGFNSCGSVQFGNQILLTDGVGWSIGAAAANVTFTNPGAANQTILPRIVGE